MKIGAKTIEIYKAQQADAPLVILNEYMPSNGAIYQKCLELGCPDFTLAEITGLDWNNDLSPWESPPIGAEDMPFGGRADAYLELLLGQILPAVIGETGAKPKAVMLAGYSLAGLFALYAATKCDAFCSVASCSGSLWYPGFVGYLTACNAEKLPRTVYLSLGDREARTKNETLRTVEERTRMTEQYLAASGVDAFFELNKGNHFHQGHLRIAKGIRWILEKHR